MKRLLLLIVFFPFLLWAEEDSKYLSGAVPEVNGKVIFTQIIQKDDLSTDQIFEKTLNWVNSYFNTETNRVVYTNKEKGNIVAIGSQKLVFKSSAFVLDRSDMNYRLIFYCEGNTCKMELSNIRYEYNVSYQDEPEKYRAEEWITDKYALNRNKDKLNRGNGKFRIKTIDFVETIFADAAGALGVSSNVNDTQQTPSVTNTPTKDNKQEKGYTSFDIANIPSTIKQMLEDSHHLFMASADQPQDPEKQIQWKGIGSMFGKTIATIQVSKDSKAYKHITTNGRYTLSFYKENNDKEAWAIIECQKQGETIDGNDVSLIGEIISFRVK